MSINTESLSAFETALSGQVIRPEDDGYAEARTLYNAMIDRRPALIVRCESVEDVVSAVNFGREHGILLSVRGGGHNVAGKAMVDDGLVIDLSPMNGVRVDSNERTAHVQGGATWRDVDQATHEHGLATPGGTVSPTGVGGLTLGGGVGWLMRPYGLSCDNLLRAEVVTAQGQIVYASEVENPDLFWALRGGGGAGTFGVVTKFEFRLYPVHSVLGGLILHPYDQAREAVEFFREFTRTTPDEMALIASVMTTPEGQKVVAFGVCYVGDPEQGENLIKPLLHWGQPIMTQVGPMPYPQLQQMLDEAFPNGLQNYWRSGFLTSLDDQVIAAMITSFDEVSSPLNMLLLEQYGGAVKRVPRDATAFPHRDAEYNLGIFSRWIDPAEGDRHISWTRRLHEAVQPYSTGGAYVNYLSDADEARARAVYGEETYARLAEVRARYDPEKLFWANQGSQLSSS